MLQRSLQHPYLVTMNVIGPMVQKFFFYLTVIAIAMLGTCFFFDKAYSQEPIEQKTTVSAPTTYLEGLEAIYFDASGMLEVSGKVKNNAFNAVNGHVVIYLFDDDSRLAGTMEAPVNKGQFWGHGQSGGFDVYIPAKGALIKRVNVEFIVDRRTLAGSEN